MKGFPGILLSIVLSIATTVGDASALDQSSPQRFSLAISGGASKGAYEAGLNWAILKLVRETADMQTVTGGRFRPLSLASAAGASAGGVNTILSALIWCSRPQADGGIASSIDDNVFRYQWLLVDINDLLPAQADSENYLPDDAVLSRKEYFVGAAELNEMWRKPAFRDGCSVPMGVTVTRVLPLVLNIGDLEVKNQRFYIPFELRVQADGSAAYFFDPADYPDLEDPAMILMPRTRDAPEFSISDEQIIEAAVTTSAFPTGFGRRRLEYCRLVLRSGDVAPEEKGAESDTDLVCPEGYELDEAEFADGGLFDNLPVGLARTLAEFDKRAPKDSLPVTYIYMDPNRLRYEEPEPPDLTACASEDPPEACRIMEFSFFSEAQLLGGALGTARKHELYREATSDHWNLNLSQLSYELAEHLDEQQADFDCAKELPYFESAIACVDALRRAGAMLELAYDRVEPAVFPPFSPQRLVEAGVADACANVPGEADAEPHTVCRIKILVYRERLAEALLAIMTAAEIHDRRLAVSISRSRQSIRHDRILRVSSRGGPITGTLLGDFGSFLDFKFRKYDYYVGVYDAVVLAARILCGLQFFPHEDHEQFNDCMDRLAMQFYQSVGVGDSAGGRYVFALLAEREYGTEGLLKFSYTPEPPADRDMQIIHEGLAKALEAGETHEDDDSIFVTEDTFFEYLHAQNFEPTPTGDGSEPLLAEIMTDPGKWPTELTRRFSARLVYLERQAADLYAEREPNPDLREESYTTMMGGAAHLLQSTTYKYPDFTFSPSTAPEDWVWRYVIPYDIAFDFVEGDILVSWQPTVALSENNLLNVRASLGFTGGLFSSSADVNRKNYLGLGLGYLRRTGSTTISSFGITPTWYHAWSEPLFADQNTFGGDLNVSFLGDRMRVAFGARDISEFSQTWFLTLGVADVPGTTYWLSR